MDWILRILRAVLPFEWASYDFMLYALLAIVLISPLFGLIGTMVVNNRLSFFSDALGHSALTGIAIGVLFGIDNYVVSMVAFAILFALCISEVKNSAVSSPDTIIGVFSSTAVALGVVLLSKGGGFARFSSFLIGDILSIRPQNITMLAIVLICVLLAWAILYNRLVLVSLNPSLAASRGIPVRAIERLFILIVAVIVTVSIQWVGILIINSLLILPAASARNVAHGAKSYCTVSVLFSVVSGVSGLILSYFFDSSAGGTIVLVSAAIFMVTFLINRVKRREIRY